MIFPARIQVERMALGLPRFDNGGGPWKVIHLSDLHISRCGLRERRMVSLVNREAADMILITGDLVQSYRNDFGPCVQILGRLRARHGTFAVFGNADHTIGPEARFREYTRALEQAGVILLNNRSVRVPVYGKDLYLAGVDDPFFLFDDFAAALREVPEDAPVILLAHSPDILFPRGDALVINLLERSLMKDRIREWGWSDSTYFSPESGDVYFAGEGRHTVRVQSRQEGVFLDMMLLNPYSEIDTLLREGAFSEADRLLSGPALEDRYPALVRMAASEVRPERLHGKWKKTRDAKALSGFRLDDLPPRSGWNFQPRIDPEDFFEMDFFARKGLRYRVWMRMRAYRGSLMNDSVYLQFTDSIDAAGRPRYRIGEAAHAKDRLRVVDLILAGHTHGGQIRIPWYGPAATMTTIGGRYASGLHEHGAARLYVSRGIGTSVLPIRFRCPPEMTVFHLGAGRAPGREEP